MHCLRKLGALSQEAVARMDGLGSGLVRRFYQTIDSEIALARRGGSNGHREVGGAHMRAAAVRVGVHGDRFQSFFMTCANDASCDFAAIGDEDLGEGSLLDPGSGGLCRHGVSR